MPRRRSGSGSSRSGLRSSATTPPIWKLPCEKASRPTSASSRVGSGRRTTTGRSSSSRASRAASSRSTPRSRPRSSRSRAGSQSGCGAPTPILLRACASRRRCRTGAVSLGVAGTAPGVVLDTGSCVVVVLPGPPGELQRLWPRAVASAPFAKVLDGTTRPERRILRLYGVSESAVAKALADAGGDGDGVEATICARDFEIHIDLVVEPGAEARADALETAFTEPLARVSVRARRANRAGARARALSRARAHARHGGVVHGRAGRGTAHVGPGLERRLPRRHRRVRQRGQGAAARRSRRTFSPSTGRSPPRWPPRWRTAPASGSASTSRSR